MKKHIITLFILFSAVFAMAQTNGCLIVKEYSPNSWDILTPLSPIYEVDINDDGLYDFKYWVEWGAFYITDINIKAREGACYHRLKPFNPIANAFLDFDTPFNDPSLNWYYNGNGGWIHPEKTESDYDRLDTIPYKAGIRNEVDGDYYYGWIEVYAVNTYDDVHFHVARTCYCTIPNYPLHWGQTYFDWTVVENSGGDFATVYPSPTDGRVVITGKDLKSAEVFNSAGQRITATHGDSNLLQVDLSSQPAGFYFFNITDKDRRKCVRKVVRQ